MKEVGKGDGKRFVKCLNSPKPFFSKLFPFHFYSCFDVDGDLSAFLAPPKGFATRAIRSGQEPEQWNSLAVVPPISLSTTFKQHAPAQHGVSFCIDIYEKLLFDGSFL